MGIGKEFFELMDSIGYRFHDLTYLQTALTHSSYTNEMKTRGFRAESNESLEFLGDAVLQIIISEALFRRFGKLGEGVLTDMRKSLVCKNTLARLAQRLDMGKFLNVGNGEESLDIRNRPRVLSNAFEAMVAAVYLDDSERGGHLYRDCILGLFEREISALTPRSHDDYKTMLQQFVEKNGDSILNYKYDESGPEHSKLFVAYAFVNNNKVGSGEGRTKREAEMGAAKEALTLFGIL